MLLIFLESWKSAISFSSKKFILLRIYSYKTDDYTNHRKFKPVNNRNGPGDKSTHEKQSENNNRQLSNWNETKPQKITEVKMEPDFSLNPRHSMSSRCRSPP